MVADAFNPRLGDKGREFLPVEVTRDPLRVGSPTMWAPGTGLRLRSLDGHLYSLGHLTALSPLF